MALGGCGAGLSGWAASGGNGWPWATQLSLSGALVSLPAEWVCHGPLVQCSTQRGPAGQRGTRGAGGRAQPASAGASGQLRPLAFWQGGLGEQEPGRGGRTRLKYLHWLAQKQLRMPQGPVVPVLRDHPRTILSGFKCQLYFQLHDLG